MKLLLFTNYTDCLQFVQSIVGHCKRRMLGSSCRVILKTTGKGQLTEKCVLWAHGLCSAELASSSLLNYSLSGMLASQQRCRSSVFVHSVKKGW